MASTTFKCSVCQFFGSPRFSAVFWHIRDEHSLECNFSIKCGLEGCQATYRRMSSWRSHIYRHHKGVSLSTTPVNDRSHEPVTSDNEEQHLDDIGLNVDSDDDEEHVPVDLARQSALFVLKTRDGRRLTQTAVTGIMDDVTELFQSRLDEICHSATSILKRSQVDPSIISAVKTTVEAHREPFGGLESEYRQNSYIRDKLGLVEPVERVLGYQYKDSRRGTIVENDYCYDVPLLETLGTLLNVDTVREQIMKSHQRSDGVLADYCDGQQCRQHALFGGDQQSLQIMLYYDDAEVVNPLGSSATIHKLGLFYFSLGNFEPRLRSQLNSIYLVSVVKTSHIDKYGIDVILEPFLEHVSKLEKGVSFSINGQAQCLRGTVTLVCADNPAAHLLGGFKSLTSAFRRCRVCLATSIDVQEKFVAEELQLRTQSMHDSHCKSVQGPLREHMATTYGVWRNAALNTLKYFHVIGGIPMDVMHDVLEGVLHLNIACLLDELVGGCNLFSLDLLNERISTYAYGADIRDRPMPLNNITKFKMGASETWSLARMLPLLIGDLVPESNENWNLFLVALEITEMVMAPKITATHVAHLRELICLHHTTFKTLYPGRPLTPKCHYLVHVPQWIMRCGPLSNYWCMRFEAKHRYFKYLAKVINNFKNVAKTLAYRHQRHLCYLLANANCYLTDRVEPGPVKLVCAGSLVYHQQVCAYDASMVGDSNLQRTNWAQIRRTRYSTGDIVIIKFHDDMPVFGEIADIVLRTNGDPLLVTEMLETIVFNRHFYSYEVCRTSHTEFVVCTQLELADHHVLGLYTPQNTPQLMVPLKYCVLSDYD